MRNVFVLGLDEAKLSELRTLPDAQNLQFHQLLTIDELRHGETIPIQDLLGKAKDQLESFDGTIDAIVGYWDFPVTQMVPILCEQFGLPSASLDAVLKCEHKYWSRLEQRKAIDEVPAFTILDPDDDDPRLPEGMKFPVWLKPVKSASSASAHHIDDGEGLRSALKAERDEIGRMGEPFSYVLSLVDLPDEVASVGGTSFLVEEEATGNQVTVEGFSTDRGVQVYGIVDSITYPNSPSFLRYQYPSRLPTAVTEQMAEVSRRVISHIGLAHTTFNIEYFWDADKDALRLLEINPRHSQSHARLFQLVDGTPNHAFMIDLALGREPELADRQGPYASPRPGFRAGSAMQSCAGHRRPKRSTASRMTFPARPSSSWPKPVAGFRRSLTKTATASGWPTYKSAPPTKPNWSTSTRSVWTPWRSSSMRSTTRDELCESSRLFRRQ